MFNFIVDYLKLGIILKDGHPINHRSILKILLNPFLRYFFNCHINSCIDTINCTITKIGILNMDRQRYSFLVELKKSWIYDIDFNYSIIKKNLII